MAKDSTKLLDMLFANIKKSDDTKAKEAAARKVKTAKKNMGYEVANADEAVDTANDRLTSVIGNPDSTGAQILEAERAVQLAEANHKALAAILEARF